jgi:hypothetical protein
VPTEQDFFLRSFLSGNRRLEIWDRRVEDVNVDVRLDRHRSFPEQLGQDLCGLVWDRQCPDIFVCEPLRWPQPEELCRLRDEFGLPHAGGLIEHVVGNDAPCTRIKCVPCGFPPAGPSLCPLDEHDFSFDVFEVRRGLPGSDIDYVELLRAVGR